MHDKMFEKPIAQHRIVSVRDQSKNELNLEMFPPKTFAFSLLITTLNPIYDIKRGNAAKMYDVFKTDSS